MLAVDTSPDVEALFTVLVQGVHVPSWPSHTGAGDTWSEASAMGRALGSRTKVPGEGAPAVLSRRSSGRLRRNDIKTGGAGGV